jgi:hypothetical protein
MGSHGVEGRGLMANWQRTLRLNPEWEQAQEHEISTQELAGAVATKLKLLKPFKAEWDDINTERDDIADEFLNLAEDEAATQQNFNYVMQSLYDWGDQRLDGDWNGKKVCWIDTMSKVPA